MYLHIGSGVVLRHEEIIGIFDLDNMSYEKRSRDYLQQAERTGVLTVLGDDIPRSVVITQTNNYLSAVSSRTLARRAADGRTGGIA
jgi:hypothetical protein